MPYPRGCKRLRSPEWKLFGDPQVLQFGLRPVYDGTVGWFHMGMGGLQLTRSRYKEWLILPALQVYKHFTAECSPPSEKWLMAPPDDVLLEAHGCCMEGAAYSKTFIDRDLAESARSEYVKSASRCLLTWDHMSCFDHVELVGWTTEHEVVLIAAEWEIEDDRRTFGKASRLRCPRTFAASLASEFYEWFHAYWFAATGEEIVVT